MLVYFKRLLYLQFDRWTFHITQLGSQVHHIPEALLMVPKNRKKRAEEQKEQGRREKGEVRRQKAETETETYKINAQYARPA